jgi:hypothetical protein
MEHDRVRGFDLALRPDHRWPKAVSAIAWVPLLALLACGSREDAEPAPPPPTEETGEVERTVARGPLDVEPDFVRGADGDTLLRISGMPDQIAIDEEISFGAADRFTAASLAPDGEWFAVVTSGAAHDGGWLVRVGADEPRPAAFQYGGSLTLGPWSPDGRWAVFVEDGPAGGRTLSVADRSAVGATVDQSARPVGLPDGAELPPDDPSLEVVGWRDGMLLFESGGARYLFDPRDGVTRSAAPEA